jgi:hypothetical protein
LNDARRVHSSATAGKIASPLAAARPRT